MNEEEEDKFLKENPIVFKKYQVKRRLGEGAFGEVYLGQAIEDKSYVALKVEPRKIAKPVLQSEAFLLYSITSSGVIGNFPKFSFNFSKHSSLKLFLPKFISSNFLLYKSIWQKAGKHFGQARREAEHGRRLRRHGPAAL